MSHEEQTQPGRVKSFRLSMETDAFIHKMESRRGDVKRRIVQPLLEMAADGRLCDPALVGRSRKLGPNMAKGAYYMTTAMVPDALYETLRAAAQRKCMSITLLVDTALLNYYKTRFEAQTSRQFAFSAELHAILRKGCPRRGGLVERVVHPLCQMLADGRLGSVCVPEQRPSPGQGDSRAQRVSMMVPDFLNERLREIAQAKGVTAPRLAEHALRSYYAPKGLGKPGKPVGA